MSALDYLDGDVSDLLGLYIIKLKYSYVIQQLESYSEINIHLQYIKECFPFREQTDTRRNRSRRNRSRRNRSRRNNHISEITYLWEETDLVESVKQLLSKQTKTKFIHNWPTKFPSFTVESLYPLDSNKQSGIIQNEKLESDNYATLFDDGTRWFYKSYPPCKDTYIVDKLPRMIHYFNQNNTCLSQQN